MSFRLRERKTVLLRKFNCVSNTISNALATLAYGVTPAKNTHA